MRNPFLEKWAQDKRMMNLPQFPEQVYSQLPSLLKETTDLFEGGVKDAFFLGSLAVLSGCIPNIYGIYDSRRVYSNLYVFVIASASAGKSVLGLSKMLGQELNKYIMGSSEKKGVTPHLFIPGNSSAAAIIESLNNSGGLGIISESEADTVARAMSQKDWGGYDDNLRSAFHHEPLGSNRVGASGYVCIDTPRLSLNLSGTPGQLTAIIPSAENGLCSRFLPYCFTPEPEWRDARPKENQPEGFEGFFTDQSQLVLEMYQFMMANPCKFVLEERHWDSLNEYFKAEHKQVFDTMGLGALSIIRRLALIIYRIAMILAAVRRYEARKAAGTLSMQNPEIEILTCEDIDFNTAMSMASKIQQHSMYVYSILPKSECSVDDHIKRRFYDALPDKFTSAQSVSILKELNHSPRSAATYVEQFRKWELVKKLSHGVYEKVDFVVS